MNTRVKAYIVSRELFQVALIAYMLFVLADTFVSGVVSYFFNLNILLVITIVTGLVMVLTEPLERKEKME